MSIFIKAMTYDYPEMLPVSVGMLPAMWNFYGTELVRLVKEYPDLVSNIPDLETLDENMAISYRSGGYTDDWGCVWDNIDHGMASIVTGHPVPRREDVHTMKVPEIPDGGIEHGFMYLRLLDLRGFEEAMLDFAEECEELKILIEKVLNYNIAHMEKFLPNAGEIIYFGDDLGMQNALAIGPEKWRKYMKPCFKKIFGMALEAGKYVYMHTDGMIHEIIGDLHECGATMINPQIRANGLDNLVRTCKGKIPINLDLDRQLFPFATPNECIEHVRECVEALYLPQGGLGLSIELNYEVPLENVAALFDAARKYRMYKG